MKTAPVSAKAVRHVTTGYHYGPSTIWPDTCDQCSRRVLSTERCVITWSDDRESHCTVWYPIEHLCTECGAGYVALRALAK